VVNNFTCEVVGMPLHLARLTNGAFSNLSLSSDTTVAGSFAAHGIYVDADNHYLSFANVTIGTVESYGLHIYSDYGWSQPSTDITFDGLTINSRRGVMIGDGYDRVTLRNVNVTQQLISDGTLMFGAPHNVLIDGFTVSGGRYALMATGGDQVPATVTLRNGIWKSREFSNDLAGKMALTTEAVRRAE
jgi:hypothetical protein